MQIQIHEPMFYDRVVSMIMMIFIDVIFPVLPAVSLYSRPECDPWIQIKVSQCDKGDKKEEAQVIRKERSVPISHCGVDMDTDLCTSAG